MRPLCRQIGQWDEDERCRCREDQLQAQLPDTIDEVAVAHAVDEDEDVGGHDDAHLAVDDRLTVYPEGVGGVGDEDHDDEAEQDADGHQPQSARGLANPVDVVTLVGIGRCIPERCADDGEDDQQDAEVAVGNLIGGDHGRREQVGNQDVRRHKEDDT